MAVVSADVGDALASHLTDLPELREVIVVDRPDFVALYRAEALSSPHPRDAQDMAWLFYTSGTTGRPKGVMMTSANLAAMTLCYFVDVDPVAPGDAILYAAPMSHGAGLYNFMHVLKGARHVVPESHGFEPEETLALARALRDVSMFAAPTMVRRLVDRAKPRRATATASRPSSTAAARCTAPTSRRRSRSWAPASSRSTARASRR